jgi:hypothetical protein
MGDAVIINVLVVLIRVTPVGQNHSKCISLAIVPLTIIVVVVVVVTTTGIGCLLLIRHKYNIVVIMISLDGRRRWFVAVTTSG